MKSRAGFTLLEVLVAVAILGLGLTIVSSAQTGVFWSYSKAAKLSQAPGLLRCKMAEVELKLLQDGYPLMDDEDEGDCCEDIDADGYRCSWKIQKVELPLLPPGGMIGGDAGVPMPAASGDGELGSITPQMGANLGPLGALATGGSSLTPGGGIGQVADMMSGGGGSGGMASMVIGFVYPDLKLMLEASIRKVTVSVHWKEGESDRELTATQYVTNPQQGGLDPMAAAGLDALGQGAPAASSGGASAPAPGGLGGLGGLFGMGGQVNAARPRGRGFSLIEVMIAVAVLAMISGSLVTAFSSLKRSKEGVQRASDRYREGRMAMARITRELESAYISKHAPLDQSLWVLKTVFKAQQDSPADRLDFNSFANRRTDRDSRQSDQTELSYYSEENPHKTGQIDLLRRINTRLDTEPAEGGKAEVLATDIELFDLKFLDPLLGTWIEEWDSSTVVGQLDRLPLQIRVQLILNGGERIGGDGDRAAIPFVAKVVVPMRAPLQFAGR